MTEAIAQDEQRLEALHERFKDLGLRGYWQLRPNRDTPEPRLWRWADVYPALLEAGEVVQLGPAAFRRNVGLQTGSHTMAFGFQIVLPGESAPAHRHTNTALRFVVKGGGAYTTSDGEKMVMEPRDLLIQPNFTWHDHANDTNEPIIWIDGLDGGLVNFLEGIFREEWAEGKVQPLTRPEGYSRRLYGSSVRKPKEGLDANAMPFHYKWAETWEALMNLAETGEDDPYDGVLLEYANPVTGGPTFLTMTCHIQMLRPGQSTRPHRHTGTTHYHCVEGQGVTVIDKGATELDWGEHDSFILPSWRWHQHRNASKTEPALLFSITDTPILEAAGLHRVEKG